MDDKQQALGNYVSELFATEDDTLATIQAETRRNDMPQISLAPQEGRLLQFLVKAVQAKKVVEIGTLAGYSGTWLARALPDDGKLFTLEVSSKHAAVARANFAHAGLSQKVELLEGPALQSLNKLTSTGPFDLVFIDADKGSYPQYLDWAVENLRVGGIVTAHNAFRGGSVISPRSDDDNAMHNFNQSLATNNRLFSTIFAIGDGMAAGVKIQ